MSCLGYLPGLRSLLTYRRAAFAHDRRAGLSLTGTGAGDQGARMTVELPIRSHGRAHPEELVTSTTSIRSTRTVHSKQ